MGNIPPAEPTRFPNGISTNQNIENLGFYSLPDPAKWHTHFDDFNEFDPLNWVITSVGPAGIAGLTEEDGGVLRLIPASGAANSIGINKNPASFTIESGKKLIFKTRFKLSNVSESTSLIGLHNLDTTPLDFLAGLSFINNSGQSTLVLAIRDSGVETSVNVTDMSDGVYVNVGFYFDGIDKVQVFLNDQKVATTGIENLPFNQTLTYGVFTQNVTADEAIFSDLFFIAKER